MRTRMPPDPLYTALEVTVTIYKTYFFTWSKYLPHPQAQSRAGKMKKEALLLVTSKNPEQTEHENREKPKERNCL